DLLALPDKLTACTEAFLAHLASRPAVWDVGDLNDLREDSALPRGRVHEDLRAALVFHRMCPGVPLGASGAAFARGLGKNLRANVGSRRRQLEKAFTAEFDTVKKESLRESMEALFRLHNRRWQKRGAAGAFSDPRVQAFHHEVSARFLE